MVNFGYPYNDIVICKDSTDYLPKSYTGDIRKDRCKGGGGVMIATKQEYDIQGIELDANFSAEIVWATISLKTSVIW